MKTFIVSSLLSACLAVPSVAHAQTNAIDVQLEFLSQATNYTEYCTNVEVVRSGPRTNRVSVSNYFISTNMVYKAARHGVTTADVIAAIAPDAPIGASLALITETGSPSYVAIRVDCTNFLVVTNLSVSVLNTVYAETEIQTATTDFTVPNSDLAEVTELLTASLVTPTLSFSVAGVSRSDCDPSPSRRWAIRDPDCGFAVGSGSDSLGTNEIVTGRVLLR